jgi:hypothetical protein
MAAQSGGPTGLDVTAFRDSMGDFCAGWSIEDNRKDNP